MTADEHRAALSALRRDVVPTPRGSAFEAWRAETTARRLEYIRGVAGLDADDPAAAYLEKAARHHDVWFLAELAALLERVADRGLIADGRASTQPNHTGVIGEAAAS